MTLVLMTTNISKISKQFYSIVNSGTKLVSGDHHYQENLAILNFGQVRVPNWSQ